MIPWQHVSNVPRSGVGSWCEGGACARTVPFAPAPDPVAPSIATHNSRYPPPSSFVVTAPNNTVTSRKPASAFTVLNNYTANHPPPIIQPRGDPPEQFLSKRSNQRNSTSNTS